MCYTLYSILNIPCILFQVLLLLPNFWKVLEYIDEINNKIDSVSLHCGIDLRVNLICKSMNFFKKPLLFEKPRKETEIGVVHSLFGKKYKRVRFCNILN